MSRQRRSGRAPGSTKTPTRHVWMRVRRRMELVVGSPTLAIAILLVGGLIFICGFAIYIAERAHPGMDNLRSGFGWVFLAMLHDPPWDPTTTLGKGTFYTIEILKPAAPGTGGSVGAAITRVAAQRTARRRRLDLIARPARASPSGAAISACCCRWW